MATNFFELLEEVAPGEARNPFAAYNTISKTWVKGTINIQILQDKFGQYDTEQEMINITQSEGLKRYFAWLRDQGILK